MGQLSASMYHGKTPIQSVSMMPSQNITAPEPVFTLTVMGDLGFDAPPLKEKDR